MLSVARAFISAVILSFLAIPAWAQSIDPAQYYRLSTQFRGATMALDVFNGGAKNNLTHLTNAQQASGQYWRFRSAGNGYYKLSTLFRGQNMCLDVFNGGRRNNQVHLTQCANYSGQFWKVIRVGNWVRFTTQFRGDGMCLDIFNGGPDNNQPHLTKCANYSGQYWRISPTNSFVGNTINNPGTSIAPPRVKSQTKAKTRSKIKVKKRRKFRVGSCAYWKDQWKQSGSRGAYRKMSDACGTTAKKKCGRNAYRTSSGRCRCNKNYQWRQGKCQWRVDKKGFEIAPWKRPGCKTWLRQCNGGNGAACRKHEANCQVN